MIRTATRTSRVAMMTAMATVALACTTAPAHAEALAQTDTSWLVTASGPSAGWNTSAAFNTATWQSATVLYNVADYLPAESPLTKGIWSSGGQFSTTETTVWARRLWNLASLPTSASLHGGFDDDADVWINGTQVISDHNGIANNVGPVDITPYLSLGDNLIAFTASDNFRVYGYNHAAWVQIDGQRAAAVPEPATPALMLAGLVATAFGARRRKTPASPQRKFPLKRE
jgi:PEP-CTERM motif